MKLIDLLSTSQNQNTSKYTDMVDITSSILHNVSHYKGNDPNNNMVKQILNTDCRSLSTPATMYGKER